MWSKINRFVFQMKGFIGMRVFAVVPALSVLLTAASTYAQAPAAGTPRPAAPAGQTAPAPRPQAQTPAGAQTAGSAARRSAVAAGPGGPIPGRCQVRRTSTCRPIASQSAKARSAAARSTRSAKRQNGSGRQAEGAAGCTAEARAAKARCSTTTARAHAAGDRRSNVTARAAASGRRRRAGRRAADAAAAAGIHVEAAAGHQPRREGEEASISSSPIESGLVFAADRSRI